ncbi:MAG: biotin/lipoyl-containing protein [Halobacteriota archaeon]|nr:biotin/lipoyl-containing protein [Halobacteriota archaeon]
MRKFKVFLDGEEHEVEVEDTETESVDLGFAEIRSDIKVKVSGEEFKIALDEIGSKSPRSKAAVRDISVQGAKIEVSKEKTSGAAAQKVEGNAISSPMQGTVLKILVQVGDEIKKGDIVAVVEAMKMENEIESDVSGTVKGVSVSEGDKVATGDAIIIVG